jgi:hypothetical protein
MTTTGLPSYDTEGRIYAKYITQARPDAKIAILYQNDDLGKDFVLSLQDRGLPSNRDLGWLWADTDPADPRYERLRS